MGDILDDERNSEELLELTRTTREDILESDELAEDNDTPAADARSVGGVNIPVDHQLTDVAMDPHERYDEGVSGATEVDGQYEDNAEDI